MLKEDPAKHYPTEKQEHKAENLDSVLLSEMEGQGDIAELVTET